MKKISNKQVQTALLRGAALVSVGAATFITALFFDDFYGLLATILVGAGAATFIDNIIKES